MNQTPPKKKQKNPNYKGNYKAIANQAQNNHETMLENQKNFLILLEKYFPNIARAAKETGIKRSQAIEWKRLYPEFAKNWAEIQDRKLDELESTVYDYCKERGGAGYVFPILKAYRSEQWSDRLQHSGYISSVNIGNSIRGKAGAKVEPGTSAEQGQGQASAEPGQGETVN